MGSEPRHSNRACQVPVAALNIHPSFIQFSKWVFPVLFLEVYFEMWIYLCVPLHTHTYIMATSVLGTEKGANTIGWAKGSFWEIERIKYEEIRHNKQGRTEQATAIQELETVPQDSTYCSVPLSAWLSFTTPFPGYLGTVFRLYIQ